MTPPDGAKGLSFSIPAAAFVLANICLSVVAIVRDFARREVCRQAIPDDQIHRLRHELSPGTYNVEFVPEGKKAGLYQPEGNVNFTIGPSGACVLGPYGAKFEILLKRKIEILSPSLNEKVQGDVIHFRWKPIPGVSSYQVAIMPMYVPGHRGTIDVESRPTWVTKTASLDLPAAKLFEFGRKAAYVWTVHDGDGDEPPSGDVAAGDSVFLGSGVPDYTAKSYDGDELIDMQHETRYVQAKVSRMKCPGWKSERWDRIRRFSWRRFCLGQGYAGLNGKQVVWPMRR